ncbi:SCO1664 family protein [Dermatophilus congolensis]|uniref:SCO1664 family protein n=1 Tax=Dermatophilus congolensis TaxID=1863 RepID=UPI001AB05975|nr:SCO1664 family protein [Dermatophilus congolensis]MBO3145332.1 SCO1664 family protein [Dermatophilus congolensis]
MTPQPLTPEQLHTDDITLIGRLTEASNAVYLAHTAGHPIVYKPISGETPLWDFPHGTLAARETAAYLISAAGGWDLIPTTVLREGPLGPGSVQEWIGPTPEKTGHLHHRPTSTPLINLLPPTDLPPDWVPIAPGTDHNGTPTTLATADHPQLRSLATLDAVLNNADRKGSHILLWHEHIWGIDNGLCLSETPKLRTVLWGWAGKPLPKNDIEKLTTLQHTLHSTLEKTLKELLTPTEITALHQRITALQHTQHHPHPDQEWPALPWPPI